MRAHLSLTLGLLLLVPNLALADLKLRQSVADKNAITKPAVALVTWPEHGSATYSANAGLTWEFNLGKPDVDAKSQWDLGIVAEYHGNTNVEKKQDSRFAGLSVSGLIGTVLEQSIQWLPTLAVQYKGDRIADTDGLVIRGDVTVATRPLGIGRIVGPRVFGVYYQPTIGTSYEWKDAPSDESSSVLRASGSFDLVGFPLRDLFDDRLEVEASIVYWRDVTRTGAIEGPKDNRLAQFGASYYLNSNRNYGVILQYQDGSDPIKGLADQRFTQLSLAVQF